MGATGAVAPLLSCELGADGEDIVTRRRLDFLMEASEILTSSLDIDLTLSGVADLLVPLLADWCTIHLIDDDGTMRRVVVRHDDPAKVDLAAELMTRQRINVQGDHPVGHAIRTGKPQLVPTISREFMHSTATEPRDVELYEELGARSAVAAPLVARGRTLGILSLTLGHSGRRYTEDDLVIIELLTRRCALAVDNARLYEATQVAMRSKDESLALLDSLFSTAPVGLAFVDDQLRFVRVNDYLAQMNGVPVDEHIGRTVRDVLPGIGHLLEGSYRAVLASGRPIIEQEVSGETAADAGAIRYWRATYYPITGPDGTRFGVGAIVREVTDEKLARDELRQRARQQAAVAELGERALRTSDVGQLMQDALEVIRRVLAVDFGAVLELDPVAGVLEVIATSGWPAEVTGRTEPATAESQAGYTLVRNRPVIVRDAQSEHRFALPSEALDAGVASTISVVIRGHGVGVMGAASLTRRDFAEYDVDFFEAVANVVGAAWARAHAEAGLRAERERLNEAQERFEFLASASAQLAESLDYRSTLARAARIAVPRLADWCTIEVPDEEHQDIEFVVAHVDAEKVDLAHELRRRFPPDPRGRRGGVPAVMRTGRPTLIAEITDDLLAANAENEEHLSFLRELGIRSVMIVPLVARGRTIGAASFISEKEHRRYSDEDLRLAEELARRAAIAIDNARLYRDRSHVARTLQESLLPPRLPKIPGIEIAARYRFAGEGNEIGGDFYDLFETGDGAWAIVVGDACGKGPEAAALTGLARHSVRAAAVGERVPSRVLALLNESILGQVTDNRFLTAAYARLEPGEGSARMIVACGGHPPPMVVRSSGVVEVTHSTGTLVGILPDAEFTDECVELNAGDAMVLYTDGVVEARRGDDIFGEDRLRDLLTTCTKYDARGVANAVRQAVADFQPGVPHDDMAILVLRVKDSENGS